MKGLSKVEKNNSVSGMQYKYALALIQSTGTVVTCYFRIEGFLKQA